MTPEERAGPSLLYKRIRVDGVRKSKCSECGAVVDPDEMGKHEDECDEWDKND